MDRETLEEVIINAKDVLSGIIYTYQKNNKVIPKPTLHLSSGENKMVVFIDLWIDPIFDKVQNQKVKKTLTIPRWLDEAANKEKIDFSSVLQTVLKKELNIIK